MATLYEQQRDLLRMGLDYYGVKQVACAMKTWKQVVALGPNSKEGQEAAGYILTVQNDIDAAKRVDNSMPPIYVPAASEPHAEEVKTEAQADYVRLGLDAYGSKLISKAMGYWRAVVKADSKTKYGQEAAGYMAAVQLELNDMLDNNPTCT